MQPFEGCEIDDRKGLSNYRPDRLKLSKESKNDTDTLRTN